MTKIKISLEDPEVKEVWDTALAAKQEVANWPAWKRGEDAASTASATADTTTVPRRPPTGSDVNG